MKARTRATLRGHPTVWHTLSQEDKRRLWESDDVPPLLVASTQLVPPAVCGLCGAPIMTLEELDRHDLVCSEKDTA